MSERFVLMLHRPIGVVERHVVDGVSDRDDARVAMARADQALERIPRPDASAIYLEDRRLRRSWSRHAQGVWWPSVQV